MKVYVITKDYSVAQEAIGVCATLVGAKIDAAKHYEQPLDFKEQPKLYEGRKIWFAYTDHSTGYFIDEMELGS